VTRHHRGGWRVPAAGDGGLADVFHAAVVGPLLLRKHVAVRAGSMAPPLPVSVSHKCGVCSRLFTTSAGRQRHRSVFHPLVPLSVNRGQVPPLPPPLPPQPPRSLAPLVTGRRPVDGGGRSAGTPSSLPVFSFGRGPASVSSRVWSSPPLSQAAGTASSDTSTLADRSASRPDVLPLGRSASRVHGASLPPQQPMRSRAIVGILADRIYAYCRAKGDTERTRSVCNPAVAGTPSAFNNPALRKIRLFAVSTGRSGLSVTDKHKLWDTIVAAERATTTAAGSSALGPMESAFGSAAAFSDSFKGEQDRCLAEQGWRVTDIVIDGQTFQFYSRNLWDVAVEAIVGAARCSFLGERRVRRDGSIIRSGTLDSDFYLEEQARVFADYRDHSDENIFVLSTQLFSDATVVSWSGGTSDLFWVPYSVVFPLGVFSAWSLASFLHAVLFRSSTLASDDPPPCCFSSVLVG